MHTEERDIPNKCPIVRYSQGVARVHAVTATQWSTVMALRMLLSFLDIVVSKTATQMEKVSLLMRKFSGQSFGENVCSVVR